MTIDYDDDLFYGGGGFAAFLQAVRMHLQAMSYRGAAECIYGLQGHLA